MTDGQKTEKTDKKPKRKMPIKVADLAEKWKKTVAKFRPKRKKQKTGKKPEDPMDIDIKRVVIFAVVLMLAFCATVYFLFFKVSTVKVVGANIYTEEEIVSAMGINLGKTHIYSFNAFTVAKRIRQKCPQIAEIAIKRHPPATVVVTVTEEAPVYYAKFYGEWRALSATLRVLEETDEETAKENGLIYLLLPGITKAVAGEAVTFAEEYSEQLTRSLLQTLVKAGYINARVTGIDIRNIYDIRIVVDNMYRFELGEKRNFDVSIRVISALLQNEDFQQYATVKLRVCIDGEKSYYLIPAADMELYG